MGVGVGGCVVAAEGVKNVVGFPRPSVSDLRSLEGLVAAVGLAAVEVAVHAGINLVHHVRLVRADSVGGRAGAVSSAGLVEVVMGVCGSSETTSMSRSAVGGCGASEGTGAGVSTGVSTGVSSGVSSRVSAVVHVGVDTGIRSVSHSAAVRANSSLRNTRGVSGGVFRAHVVAAEGAGLVSAHGVTAEGAGASVLREVVTANSTSAGGLVSTYVAAAEGAGLVSTHGVAAKGAGASVLRDVVAAEAASASVLGGVVSTGSRGTMRVGTHVAAVVTIRVDTGVGLVHEVGVVRTIGLGGRAICSAEGSRVGAVAGTSGSVVAGASLCGAAEVLGSAVVSIRVNARVSSVGRTGVVMSVSTLGLRRLVGVESLLDLVDERRHDEELMLLWGVVFVLRVLCRL